MFTSELLNKVYQYIEGDITLNEFEQWLAPRLPSYFSQPDSDIADFVAGIQLGLADLGNGLHGENEFRNLLKELVLQIDTLWLSYPADREISSTTSANKISFSAIYEPGQTPSFVFNRI